MAAPPAFAPLARSLRDEVIEHYERAGKRLDSPAGLRTLDTNSLLAADRGRLLLRLLAERGAPPVEGRRLLDLGAGFGSLSIYFAHLGADVVAVDANEARLGVAVAVGRRFGLPVRAVAADLGSLPLPDASFDVVVANNSLCYVLDRAHRRSVLAEALRVLEPGGWLVVRNPNRLHPVDLFSGVPLASLFPPRAAAAIVGVFGRDRSRVRLTTPGGAARELRRAGFVAVRVAGGGRPASRIAGYHHVVARRPDR